MKPSVLLFDIGGVLVDFIGPEGLCDMLNGRYSVTEIRQLWPESSALRRYETGRIDEARFAEEFILEWELDVSSDAFLREFSTWLRAPLDGALSLLDDLRGSATLACLTNINPTFWGIIRDDMGFGTRFDHCYASHEIGLLKPTAECYRHVISSLSCDPAEILFFDDTLDNVTSARSQGMRAQHVRGMVELKSCLAEELNEIRL